ncbi:twin-arginine translocase TatA/TatE family subunit [Mucilaginibacter sp. 14171R-50]|uniref:Sec-independent protein translocase subunit TatA/TatB n=1 Tax=Mucilaginibacter sp. 14171R-50 TaxID=2703789 RepID=UPI00138CA57B|nr:twin-arginine translocase TatA/TatE family subunit [Mucilaginibacter sp. 14171R-50]QHS54570.1 twin-arginine translocase TatA/TatE family subunit [Mucilaginibacter sp. 14171R-50]
MLNSVFLFLNIGSGEMILILFAALMLFGGNKLPELARGLGKGIRDFKDASEDVKREINNQINNYEDKKVEKKAEPEVTDENEPAGYTYEPVAGTLPAFEGHAVGTDAIEDTAPVVDGEVAKDAAFEHQPEELKHPVTGSANSSIDLTKAEEPVNKTTEEEYK